MPNYHIKSRRDTAANWASRNPTPADGEICIETDTKRKKIGDGITAYTNLPYDQPGIATQSAAGLMSASDKQKLDNINMSLYAKLASPEFTGTPKAPTASSYSIDKQIATLPYVLNSIAESVLSTLAVRVTFSLSATANQTVINSTGLASCIFIAVNGKAVSLDTTQKLNSGTNIVDFLFEPGSNMLIDIPGSAFRSVSNIQTVTLPERVRKVGQNCFAGTMLKYLYALSPTPPTLESGALTGTGVESGTGTAYCHKAFATLYQTEWATIPNISTI